MVCQNEGIVDIIPKIKTQPSDLAGGGSATPSNAWKCIRHIFSKLFMLQKSLQLHLRPEIEHFLCAEPPKSLLRAYSEPRPETVRDGILEASRTKNARSPASDGVRRTSAA